MTVCRLLQSPKLALSFEPSLNCFLPLEEATGSLLVRTTNKHVLCSARASWTAVRESERRLQVVARIESIRHDLGAVTGTCEDIGGAGES